MVLSHWSCVSISSWPEGGAVSSALAVCRGFRSLKGGLPACLFKENSNPVKPDPVFRGFSCAFMLDKPDEQASRSDQAH